MRRDRLFLLDIVESAAAIVWTLATEAAPELGRQVAGILRMEFPDG